MIVTIVLVIAALSMATLLEFKAHKIESAHQENCPRCKDIFKHKENCRRCKIADWLKV